MLSLNLKQPIKISIIIVTYNAAKTLQVCLNSIRVQKHKNIEIIVMDGESTDGTVNILRENDSIIDYWISSADNGIYDAMNNGLKHATGDWIYFVGADDELLPDFSEMIIQLKDPSVIYYANVIADKKVRLGKLNNYQVAKHGIYHQATIYPSSVFEKYKYDTRYKISADYALLITLCGDRSFRINYLNFVIANFNHLGISGINVDQIFQNDKAKLIRKSFGLITALRYKLHKYKNRKNPRA